MAKITLISTPQFIIIFFFLLFSIADPVSGKNFGFKKEKLSHFRFYWHDILNGSSPSSVTIVPPPSMNSSILTGFGTVNMIDNALTEGPEMSSKLIGRAQGFYALASQQEVSLLMSMNFVFVQGKYNGSTITVHGRNSIFSPLREMPVIGGSGLFRFARGYVQLRTHTVDLQTRNAVVRYDAYVLHY